MTRYEDLPYRACVGIMLINKDGLVFIGRRAGGIEHVDDTHVWQMPQGGVDPGEDTWAAAKRELMEETNVRSVEKLGEVPDWLTYDIPRTIAGRAWKGRYRGQRQKWYAMRFTGKDDEINVASPARPQAGIHRLALGADEEPSRADRSVQAPGLRARGEGIFQPRGRLRWQSFLPWSFRGAKRTRNSSRCAIAR